METVLQSLSTVAIYYEARSPEFRLQSSPVGASRFEANHREKRDMAFARNQRAGTCKSPGLWHFFIDKSVFYVREKNEKRNISTLQRVG